MDLPLSDQDSFEGPVLIPNIGKNTKRGVGGVGGSGEGESIY